MTSKIIEKLQDQVQHNRISAKELGEECEKRNLLLHEDVLAPIGYNTCDRCGEYGDSELDFLWVDTFPWDEDNPSDQVILRNLEREGIDYCTLCWKCVDEMKKSIIVSRNNGKSFYENYIQEFTGVEC